MTIATVADMGEMCSRPDGGCGNATIAALGKAAADGRFSALVHAGDIAWVTLRHTPDNAPNGLPLNKTVLIGCDHG